MSWLQRYRVRHYINNSIQVLPLLAIPAALIAVRLIHRLDTEQGWVSSIHPDTARAVLGTLAAAMFTFVVFVASALLVAVQLASAQLTPRIIALVFKDPINRFAFAFFVFTFTFSLAALIRVDTGVPLLTVYTAAYACVASLGVFLFLIDHVGKSLRPSGVLRVVSLAGRRVVDDVYPHRLEKDQEGTAGKDATHFEGERDESIPSMRDGVVLAFDQQGLLWLAERAGCVIEMVPQVGDHVTVGDPLFRLHPPDSVVPAAVLCQSVAVGQERTLEQDPTFAFRIMVDIASKALSPAINDPTTAVLALDEIHHLLGIVGRRRLDTGRVLDGGGRLRLVYRTPDWEDFVRLAVTEIRHFGGESIQVARRLRAMLENLIQTLPPTRSALLRQELAVLHRAAERFFSDPEDRALAEVSDLQGVGGKHS